MEHEHQTRFFQGTAGRLPALHQGFTIALQAQRYETF